MTTATFQGRVLMYSTRDGAKGPKEVPLAFRASFGAGGAWSVTPADFGSVGKVVIPGIDTPLGSKDLTVTLTGTARGTSDRVNRAIALDAKFNFYIALANSTLPLRLDTGSHALPHAAVTGRPLDAGTGGIGLAAEGTFHGGHLHGDRCIVQIDGTLTPNPWA